MQSLIVNALFALEIEWSEVEKYLKVNQNWRYPNTFWGKLSKYIFGRNRACQRSKIMNIWRKNQTKIHHKFLSFRISDESDKPLQNLPISISFRQFPAAYFLTPVGRSLISQSQIIALDNLESLSTSSTDSNFTYISLVQFENKQNFRKGRKEKPEQI